MQQVLTPGVEDREKADFRSQMFRITRDLEKGFCAGAEQQVIEHLLVLQHELRELLWQGEDDMNVGHCQKIVLTSRDPLIAGAVLTLRAVAIATAVVGDGPITAARTLVAVTAQNGSAAGRDGLQDLAVRPVNPAALILDEVVPLCANDIGHLQGWPAHFFSSLRERLTCSRLESWSESSGLAIAWRCLGETCK